MYLPLIREVRIKRFYDNCDLLTVRTVKTTISNYGFLPPASHVMYVCFAVKSLAFSVREPLSLISTNTGRKTQSEEFTAKGEILVYFRSLTSIEGAARKLSLCCSISLFLLTILM